MHSMSLRVVKFAAVAAAVLGFAAETQAKTYSDEYSTDSYKGAANLIGHWDGIDNVGEGTHVPGATQWIYKVNPPGMMLFFR